MNNKGFAVSGIIYSIMILFLILIFGVLSILGARKLVLDKLKNDIMNDLNNESFELAYRDRSGANRPELGDNMIPIKYNGSNWVYADIYEEWYNYETQQWANAVVLNSGVTKNVGDVISESEIALWYVWIPRYKYQLFNANNESVEEQVINIKFETGSESTGTVSCVDAINQTDENGNLISEICTNAENGNWYTHPAFTFGDEEISGFWVGKFEVSGTTSNITIKPGVQSLRSVNVSGFFTAIQNMKSTYSLSGDSHMIKNMEWGAVAYLKQSRYGLGINDIIKNSSYYVGGGSSTSSYRTNIAQSTTGNVYGVYDMSGGSWEYVMGNMVDSNGNFYSSSSGFSIALESKYYDSYSYSVSGIVDSRGKLGDATKEVLKEPMGTGYGGWYGDFSNFLGQTKSLIARGAYISNGDEVSGIYASGSDTGIELSYAGTRAILIP